MMDLIALFLEFVATIVILVTKPFSLLELSCIFGVRSFCIVILTWVELVRVAVSFHKHLLWRLMIWTFAFISLPVRILTALQREKLLQMHLNELQNELENLVLNRKEHEECLQMVMRECRMMEAMLAELEVDYDEAIVKIELLESELHDVRQENLHLKEMIQGKELRSFGSRDNTAKGNDCDTTFTAKYAMSYCSQTLKPGFKGSGFILQDLQVHKEWEEESKSGTELVDFSTTGMKSSGPSYAVTHGIVSATVDINEVLAQLREIAVLQSLFTALLSLVVGMVVWEAEDPCAPLVVALFCVVCMSLKSVVQFLASVKNKPAIDAIALLSFNWFVLGTLAYPTLPTIAQMLTQPG